MPALTNKDLEAVPSEGRTWGTLDYAALWIGMAVCIPTYTLASGLIGQGMNWYQAVGTILLANLIVLVPMVLNGHAGARYGIPFPVLVRSSFGTLGANVPAMLRAFVACGWFAINTWFGGAALWVVISRLTWGHAAITRTLADRFGVPGPQLDPVTHAVIQDAGVLYKLLDVPSGEFLCFLVFWVVNMAVVWAGIDGIKKLLKVKSVFLPVATLALVLWAYVAAKGFGKMWDAEGLSGAKFMAVFAPGVTGMVGFWSTLSLNIPDFTRYAKDQRSQVTGQALGLPTSMTAVAFVGVAVTSATAMLPEFGFKEEWQPIAVVNTGFTNNLVVAFAMFCVVLSSLATNIAANIVSPANDFANLAPSKITFRVGGLMTGVIGILTCPWLLVKDPGKYINGWLVGYSGLMGPIAGIMIVDYFVIRRMALDVKDLYQHDGRYRYTSGWNLSALGALALGILPIVPGFLVGAQVLEKKGYLVTFAALYDYAWFVGFAISGGLYLVLMKAKGADAMRDAKPV